MTLQQAFNNLISKIETNFSWLNINKANVSHTHNQYQDKILTGYSKAASVSAINTSDTVSQALGKLEKSIDNISGGDEIPLLFGQWSELGSPSEKWVEVDGTTSLNAADYPEAYEILTDILAGNTNGGDVYVISAADAATILAAEDTDEEALANKRDLAYKYIVNTTAQTFKLPRCIPDTKCLGNNNIKVIKRDSERGGYYEINNNGRYYENSCVARLEKITTSGTKETPIEVTGKQIVLKFTVPADKDGTAFPASDVLLYEESSQGNKIYTLKNFQNNAAYTFTYGTNYSDIKLYFMRQYFPIGNTSNGYVLKFNIPFSRIDVTENNSKVIVQCAVAKTSSKIYDKPYIPNENFVPAATANSPESITINAGLKLLRKTGDSTNGYQYSDDYQYYTAGTYTTADKTVLDTTVTTSSSHGYVSHKVTEWDDEETDITLSTTAKKYCDDKSYNYVTTPIEVNFSKTLIDGNLELCKTKVSENTTPGGNTLYEINNFYFGADWDDIDNDGFSVAFPVYDEALNDSEVLSDAIPEGETESMVSFTICGHVVPPLVSEYSSLTDFRLYIKLK